jgi:nitroreductase
LLQAIRPAVGTPAVQNLMLAARAIGIGSVPTTLHPSVMARFPQDVRQP